MDALPDLELDHVLKDLHGVDENFLDARFCGYLEGNDDSYLDEVDSAFGSSDYSSSSQSSPSTAETPLGFESISSGCSASSNSSPSLSPTRLSQSDDSNNVLNEWFVSTPTSVHIETHVSPASISSVRAPAVRVRSSPYTRPPQALTPGTVVRLKPITLPPPPTVTCVQPLTPAPSLQKVDERRELRKAQNRKSAQESRQRHQMEFQFLKQRVDELEGVEKENHQLREENRRLREELAACRCRDIDTESGKPHLESSSHKKAIVSGAVLLSVFCLFTIPFAPLGELQDLDTPIPAAAVIASNRSRLLSNEEVYYNSTDFTGLNHTMGMIHGNMTAMDYKNCSASSNYNVTEFTRMNSLLRSWVFRHNKMELSWRPRAGSPWRLADAAFHPPKNMQKRVKVSARNGAEREAPTKKDVQDPVGYPLSRSGPLGIAWPSAVRRHVQQVVAKLGHQKDSIYVIALQQYFLLPAESKDVSKPRVTLILPALSHNDTTSTESSLIRIECEVVGTEFLQLPQGLLSKFRTMD